MSRSSLIPPSRKKSLDKVIAEFMDDIKGDSVFQAKLQYIRSKEAELEKFIKEGKTGLLTPSDQLVVLRKWNSYTPVLPPEENSLSNKGGGYFIRIGQAGIVIDPGYNFIENFLNAGFKLDDIDYIFITHAHNDHTIELEGIFSLLYKRNRSSKSPKKIKIYMNLGSFKKFSGYFDLSSPGKSFYIDDIILLNKHQYTKVSSDIEVFTTHAKHHEMITKEYSLGYIFKLRLTTGKHITLKFTGDTGWDKAIEDKNIKEADEFQINEYDILIAHIGSIKKKELEYNTTKTLKGNAKYLYENHLGLIGTLAMLHYSNPELTLISEFGEEMSAARVKVAEKIGEALKQKVYATDINFRVDLETQNIMCHKTKEFCDPNILNIYTKEDQIYYINRDSLDPIEREEIDKKLGSTIRIFK